LLLDAMKYYTFYLSTVSICIFAVLMLPAELLGQQQDSTAADSVLLRQIQQELGDSEESADEGRRPTGGSSQTQGVRATSANLNPDISAIGDFRSLYTSEGDRNWDAYVQGVELSFRSVIDPYARADFYPVFEGEGGELNAKIEEAYLTTLSLPLNLQLKAGKFRQSFGRANLVHRHALPVIDVPVAYETFLGEAMIDQGASLSWLIPNPSFYQELIVEITRGPDESPLFHLSEGNEVMKLAHLKNFWSLSDNATLQLGLSGAIGENEALGTSRLGGIDITYIWKPLQRSTYRSFEWQTELFFSNTETDTGEEFDAWGVYSWMQYQVAQRWFLTGMYSYAQQPFDPDLDEQALSANLGWYATEFQKLEIGPQLHTESGFGDSSFSLRFRWVFVIGAHGAHEY